MSLTERIQDLRTRPHHEKKRAVFALAALGTGLVAVVWFGGSLATNSFAIVLPLRQESAGVESVPQAQQYAAAAAAPAPSAKAQDSGIEIISTATSSSLSGARSGQTVIPF